MKVSNPLFSDPIRVRTTFLTTSYNRTGTITSSFLKVSNPLFSAPIRVRTTFLTTSYNKKKMRNGCPLHGRPHMTYMWNPGYLPLVVDVQGWKYAHLLMNIQGPTVWALIMLDFDILVIICQWILPCVVITVLPAWQCDQSSGMAHSVPDPD